MDIGFPANEIAATDDPGGRARDHRRVVGAIREPWIGDRHVGPQSSRTCWRSRSRSRALAFATGENDGASAELERGSRGLDRQRLDDRFLESGGEIGDGSICRVRRRLMRQEGPLGLGQEPWLVRDRSPARASARST